MRRVLVLLILATFAAACAKKPAPVAPGSPPPADDKAPDAAKPTDGAPTGEPEGTPSAAPDPCGGGE